MVNDSMIKSRGMDMSLKLLDFIRLYKSFYGIVKYFSQIQESPFGSQQSAGGGIRFCSIQVFHTHAAFCSP